jgi:protein-disulfide isomerase
MNRFYLPLKLLLLIKLFLVCFVISLIIPACNQIDQKETKAEKSYKENLNKQNNLVILGNDQAPIKIKVFSSLTCPHCANFHIKVVPKLKREYIDSGKIQIIFIDFPLDEAAFNATKLLHCSGQEKQIALLDIIYETQIKWTSGSNINDINNNLKKIVKNLGISSAKFDKCLLDEDISDKILNRRIEANQKYSINSTPTIVINEKKLEGSASFKNIKKKIEKLIK